jgi:hypothetical protein
VYSASAERKQTCPGPAPRPTKMPTEGHRDTCPAGLEAMQLTTGAPLLLRKAGRGTWLSALIGEISERGTGSQHLAELTLVETRSSILFFGVGPPSMDLSQTPAACPEWWGVDLYAGDLCHGREQHCAWAGQQGAAQGDTVGLLLDAERCAHPTPVAASVRALHTEITACAFGGCNHAWA